MPKTYRIAALVAVSLTALLLVDCATADRCVDSGGVWSYSTFTCEH